VERLELECTLAPLYGCSCWKTVTHYDVYVYCVFGSVRAEMKVNPFRDYKTLLLSSSDDRQSLELLMKQLDSGQIIHYLTYYLLLIYFVSSNAVTLFWLNGIRHVCFICVLSGIYVTSLNVFSRLIF